MRPSTLNPTLRPILSAARDGLRITAICALVVLGLALALANAGQGRRPRAATTCRGGTCPQASYAARGGAYAPRVAVRGVPAVGVAPRAASVPQAAYYVAAPAQVASYQGVASDPSFLGWLNAARAQHGLPAVGWDQNLVNWAAQNNAQQNARGIGHYILGPARRQNSAMGGAATIGPMWMNSPAHRAALLDPSIRFIGLAGNGAYFTFNAY